MNIIKGKGQGLGLKLWGLGLGVGRSGQVASRGVNFKTLYLGLKNKNLITRPSDFSQHKGFSLVELMIVVAILGVLTAIAIPNFQAFQARSRQSEAKAGLSGIYTSAQAFHSQHELYTGSLNAIGYLPAGDQRYLIGFHDDFDGPCGATTDWAATHQSGGPGCGPSPRKPYGGNLGTETNTNACAATGNLDNCMPRFNTAIEAAATAWAKGTAADPAIGAGKATTYVAVNNFTAGAVGDPAGLDDATVTSAKLDAWIIDQNKRLENSQGADLKTYFK